METTKKSSRKNAAQPSDEKLRTAYIEYVLTHGSKPVSVYKFCLDVGLPEEEFYNHFGSFDGLERAIWSGFIDKTIQRLHADSSYGGFSAREKVLAFYYTLIEELKSNRSFATYLLENSRFEIVPSYLKTFKSTFENYIEGVIIDGKSKGEIATRPFIDHRYPQLFWLHLGFVLTFWKKDDSAGFERTDAAIEKSVNLAFDLAGKGAIDSVIDFGKFLYQNKA
jgi:AcrR family transcriptional regulator